MNETWEYRDLEFWLRTIVHHGEYDLRHWGSSTKRFFTVVEVVALATANIFSGVRSKTFLSIVRSHWVYYLFGECCWLLEFDSFLVALVSIDIIVFVDYMS